MIPQDYPFSSSAPVPAACTSSTESSCLSLTICSFSILLRGERKKSGSKALAKELNVPVIVLSQLNRELEKDKSRKPRLSDLRESGSIEQDADLVGLLYKPNAGDDEDGSAPEESDGVAVNFLIAKQRNGPTGDVNLTFLKPYTRFESAAKFSDEDVPAGR